MAIIDKPSDYFNTKLYTGNGSTQSFTGVGFQPDLIWVKSRSNTEPHIWTDVVRGANKNIRSNATSSEFTDANNITSFDSNGFSVGTGGAVNENTYTFASWNWKAGTSFTNDASATGIGSIDSSGSVNTDAGFSIVSFTAGGANATVAHGLGAVPKMIIVKCRAASSTWSVYHASLGATKFLRLEDTSAVGTEAGWWNNTTPTSSVFTIGGNHSANTQIAYCFAEKQGYSKFGSYTGNGNADGTFVYTGFKPAWVMTKISSGTGQWGIADNKRGVAPSGEFLFADSSGATNSAPNNFDFLSNGFKPRADYAAMNTSGATYIYMAFAENPFVTSTGVPATAR